MLVGVHGLHLVGLLLRLLAPVRRLRGAALEEIARLVAVAGSERRAQRVVDLLTARLLRRLLPVRRRAAAGLLVHLHRGDVLALLEERVASLHRVLAGSFFGARRLAGARQEERGCADGDQRGENDRKPSPTAGLARRGRGRAPLRSCDQLVGGGLVAAFLRAVLSLLLLLVVLFLRPVDSELELSHLGVLRL